jgi:hypothetical protein
MSERMTVAAMIDEIRDSRAELDDLLALLDDSQMVQAGADGEWTVKDVIAHVSWHEREMINLIRSRALLGSDLWNLPLHERNAAIYEQNRDQSLDDVRAEAAEAFRQLLESLQTLSDEDLNDPARFEHMPAEWQPWKIIAENTWEHYHDHYESLRRWLETRADDS